MHCAPVSEVDRCDTLQDSDLTAQVTSLLADRVPAGVLDRVLLELSDIGDRTVDDDDVRILLERGYLTGRYRSARSEVAHLIGVRTAEPARLVSRLRLHAEAYRTAMTACALDGTVWVVVLPEGPRADVVNLLEQSDLAPHLALSRQVKDLRAMPIHRIRLDELLDIGVRLGWRGVADAARLDARRRVEALLDLLAQRPELLEGPLDVLFDDESAVMLADTLFHWLTHGRDTGATAAAMHLHANTVRYRLRRAQELTGLDLADGNQRLLAELQLRLWRGAEVLSDVPVRAGVQDDDVTRAEVQLSTSGRHADR